MSEGITHRQINDEQEAMSGFGHLSKRGNLAKNKKKEVAKKMGQAQRIKFNAKHNA